MTDAVVCLARTLHGVLRYVRIRIVLEWRDIFYEEMYRMPDGIEARLHELAITLPAAPSPGANYIPARTVGSIVFLSGVVSLNASGIITGTVGLDRTVEE